MSKAYSLFEGSFSVDTSKKFIPFDPEKDNPKSRPGSIFVYVHPFLIDSPEGLMVCDTGLGHYGDTGKLMIVEKIEELGFSAADVKYVLMSHLHKDHASGMADVKSGQVTFPNAVYVIQEKEWENTVKDKKDEVLNEIWSLVEDKADIQFVHGDGQINGNIHYNLSGGHTKYHQVFHIYTDDSHYFFGGDVLPEPEQLFVNFVAKYDFDGKLARALRQEYWKEGAPEKWKFLFYHSKNIAIGVSQEKSDGEYILIEAE